MNNCSKKSQTFLAGNLLKKKVNTLKKTITSFYSKFFETQKYNKEKKSVLSQKTDRNQ